MTKWRTSRAIFLENKCHSIHSTWNLKEMGSRQSAVISISSTAVKKIEREREWEKENGACMHACMVGGVKKPAMKIGSSSEVESRFISNAWARISSSSCYLLTVIIAFSLNSPFFTSPPLSPTACAYMVAHACLVFHHPQRRDNSDPSSVRTTTSKSESYGERD